MSALIAAWIAAIVTEVAAPGAERRKDVPVVEEEEEAAVDAAGNVEANAIETEETRNREEAKNAEINAAAAAAETKTLTRRSEKPTI